MGYGVVNDLITSRISWEYFYYGKGLMQSLGPATPPDPAALAWGAAKVGIKAAGSAGLIIAAILLMANNPRPGLPQLPYRRLMGWVARIFLACLLFSIALGLGGYCGLLTGVSSEFGDMVRRDEWRPYRFMAVFGTHLGGYVGGAIGGGLAAMMIRRARKIHD